MLGNIASIATLVLFIIYFVGRIITIFRTNDLFRDEISIENRNGNYYGKYDIVETFILDKNGGSFILTAKEGIYSLSLYKLKIDNDFNITGREKIDGYRFINIGQSIEIIAFSPEFFPKYELEYFTPDYKKVTISIYQNLKNGVMSESVLPKHTLKSVLYYLFR